MQPSFQDKVGTHLDEIALKNKGFEVVRNAKIDTRIDNLVDGAVKLARSEKPLDNSSGISSDRLKSFLRRIEKLEEDKAGILEDIRDIYAEAKGTGFAVKIIRQIVRLRKMEQEKRREEEELLDLYKSAVGMEV